MSAIFAYLSLDELLALHEKLTNPLHSALHTGGLLDWAWVIPYAAFVVIFVLAYLKFLLHLPVRTRNLLVLAGAIYVTGAIALDMVGGKLYSHEVHLGLSPEASLLYPPYILEATVEDVMEMFGIALLIYTLLDYLRSEFQDIYGFTSRSRPSIYSR